MPTKKPYKVMESDGHNDDTIHVFRDQKHFLTWLSSRDSDFTKSLQKEFKEEGNWTDENFVEWSEYDGLYEMDHTQET